MELVGILEVEESRSWDGSSELGQTPEKGFILLDHQNLNAADHVYLKLEPLKVSPLLLNLVQSLSKQVTTLRKDYTSLAKDRQLKQPIKNKPRKRNHAR